MAGGGKVCWHCGEKLPLVADVCPYCAEHQRREVKGEDAPPWQCPYCGRRMPRPASGAHVCQQMSDARMARARQNLRTPGRGRAAQFVFFMAVGLTVFMMSAHYYFAEADRPIKARPAAVPFYLMIVIAAAQALTGLRGKLPGAGAAARALYYLHVMLLAATVWAFSAGGREVVYGWIGLWFLNAFFVRFLGRRRWALFAAQVILLALVVVGGWWYCRAAALVKWRVVLERLGALGV